MLGVAGDFELRFDIVHFSTRTDQVADFTLLRHVKAVS